MVPQTWQDHNQDGGRRGGKSCIGSSGDGWGDGDGDGDGEVGEWWVSAGMDREDDGVVESRRVDDTSGRKDGKVVIEETWNRYDSTV